MGPVADAHRRARLVSSGLNWLAVHKDVVVAHLDKNVTESPMPNVSQDTFGSEWEFWLKGIASSHMDLGHRSVHGREVLYKTPV